MHFQIRHSFPGWENSKFRLFCRGGGHYLQVQVMQIWKLHALKMPPFISEFGCYMFSPPRMMHTKTFNCLCTDMSPTPLAHPLKLMHILLFAVPPPGHQTYPAPLNFPALNVLPPSSLAPSSAVNNDWSLKFNGSCNWCKMSKLFVMSNNLQHNPGY